MPINNRHHLSVTSASTLLVIILISLSFGGARADIPGLFGSYYKTEVVFYDADYDQRITVPNNQLKSTLTRYIANEEIVSAGVYQNPLIEAREKEEWRNILTNLFLKDYDGREELFYHAFVLIRTRNYWYSMEKNTNHVLIQRSRNYINVFRKVYLKYRGKVINGQRQISYYLTWRETPITKYLTSWGKGIRTHDLIGHLFSSGLVVSKYNVFYCSCKDFAAGVYNKVAASNKYYPLNTWTVDVVDDFKKLISRYV